MGVKDLKNNLSAYLRDVREGARVLVSDRGEAVAAKRMKEATARLLSG